MDPTAKQQVVERLKAANNVLVTVSTNPTVDQLAAAIALTLMVNAMDKHATAVFSGQIPDTMQFLHPDKTLESTVDSLRDFIIALDKNKADKLRYKVEDDVVKIFITPYRTKISQDDLDFSQGDYNVDVVVALGVHKKDELDKVIVEHGRILHDAPVIAVNTGVNGGDLGSINWADDMASSLSEMLMNISEALQPGLVSEQVATALLTGIVSETDRFSNEKTTPKVMTMAAQLMAAGANQQLIASHVHPTVANASEVTAAEAPKKPKDPSEMDISHDEPDEADEKGDDFSGPLASLPSSSPASTSEPASDEPGISLPKPAEEDEPEVAGDLPSSLPPGPIADMIHDTKAFNHTDKEEAEKPSLGGTFNATAFEANQEAQKSKDDSLNNTILTHDTPEPTAPSLPAVDEVASSPTPSIAPPAAPFAPPSPFTAPPPAASNPTRDFSPTPSAAGQRNPLNNAAFPLNTHTVGEDNPAAQAEKLDHETLQSIDSAARGTAQEAAATPDLDSARSAVEAAMGEASTPPPIEPLQAVGINGRLDIHPEDHLPEPSRPAPATPPPFAPPPFAPPTPTVTPAPGSQVPSPSLDLPPIGAPATASPTPPTAPSAPAPNPVEPPAMPAPTSPAPSPDDFKLPGIN